MFTSYKHPRKNWKWNWLWIWTVHKSCQFRWNCETPHPSPNLGSHSILTQVLCSLLSSPFSLPSLSWPFTLNLSFFPKSQQSGCWSFNAFFFQLCQCFFGTFFSPQAYQCVCWISILTPQFITISVGLKKIFISIFFTILSVLLVIYYCSPTNYQCSCWIGIFLLNLILSVLVLGFDFLLQFYQYCVGTPICISSFISPVLTLQFFSPILLV